MRGAHQLFESFREAGLGDDVVPGYVAHLAFDQAAEHLDRQVRVALLAHPLDERIFRVRQVRLSDPG